MAFPEGELKGIVSADPPWAEQLDNQTVGQQTREQLCVASGNRQLRFGNAMHAAPAGSETIRGDSVLKAEVEPTYSAGSLALRRAWIGVHTSRVSRRLLESSSFQHHITSLKQYDEERQAKSRLSSVTRKPIVYGRGGAWLCAVREITSSAFRRVSRTASIPSDMLHSTLSTSALLTCLFSNGAHTPARTVRHKRTEQRGGRAPWSPDQISDPPSHPGPTQILVGSHSSLSMSSTTSQMLSYRQIIHVCTKAKDAVVRISTDDDFVLSSPRSVLVPLQ